MPSSLFELKPARWYAWEMLPGYMASERLMAPYYSPIFIHKVQRLKTGKHLLGVEFFNACYASGAQGFELTLRVLTRKYHFMVAEIVGNDERCAILSEVSMPWIEKHCPHLLEWRPLQDAPPLARTDMRAWLDHAFAS